MASDAAAPADRLDEDREGIVKLKELGVARALQGLQGLRAKFNQSALEIPDFDAQDWVSSLDEVIKDHKSFKFLAGVAGDTGMGKTSLLNTLVNESGDVAPSSQNGACTAAVCCFKYHNPEDSSQRFKAIIKYKPKATVDGELQAIFQDLCDLLELAKDEGYDSIVRSEKQRLESQLKLVSGWSGFSLSELREFSQANKISDITSTCKKSDELFYANEPERSKEVQISKPTADAFLRECKPYISSAANVRSKTALRWPLVEIVHILLPSPFLRECPGLLLVDLPGEMDANVSRSEVARRFYGNLDRLMVVAPSDRACDNKTAAELIREDKIYDIEAGGKADEDFLSVIITKVDQLDWRQFITNEHDPEDISEAFPALYDALQCKEDELQQLGTQISDARDDLADAIDDGGSQPTNLTGSSKRGRPSTPLQQQEEALGRQQSSLQSERHTLRREIVNLETQCLQACINFRSQDSIQQFQEYFDSIRNKHRKGPKVQTQITVLPISSVAQRDLIRGNPMTGFPNSESTGFSGLKKWIIRGSLSRREDHADNILYRCVVLFDAIEGWANDDWVTTKLPSSNLEVIKKLIKAKNDDLESSMGKTEVSFNAWLSKQTPFKGHIKTDEQDILVRSFSATVNNFKYSRQAYRPRLHWATYDACIRRKGLPYITSVHPRTLHDWSAMLFSFYWSRLAETWSISFSAHLPTYLTGKVLGRIRVAITAHQQTLSNVETLPKEYREAFEKNAYKIDNFMRLYQTKVQTALSRFREDASSIRAQSRNELIQSLGQIFREASDITGKGKAKRQVAILEEYAESNAEEIIVKINNEILKKLRRAKRKMNTELRHCHGNLRKSIAGLENKIAQQLCSPAKDLKPTRNASINLFKQELLGDIDKWSKYWAALKPQIPDRKIRMPEDDEEYLTDAEGVGDEDSDDADLAGSTTGVQSAKKPKTSAKKGEQNKGPTSTQRGKAVSKAPRAPAKSKAVEKQVAKTKASDTAKKAVKSAETVTQSENESGDEETVETKAENDS